ncbi:MAG: hypothetical protein NUV57_00455 [archaeon]|nr:hypothetical protein [archaeon]
MSPPKKAGRAINAVRRIIPSEATMKTIAKKGRLAIKSIKTPWRGARASRVVAEMRVIGKVKQWLEANSQEGNRKTYTLKETKNKMLADVTEVYSKEIARLPASEKKSISKTAIAKINSNND